MTEHNVFTKENRPADEKKKMRKKIKKKKEKKQKIEPNAALKPGSQYSQIEAVEVTLSL